MRPGIATGAGASIVLLFVGFEIQEGLIFLVHSVEGLGVDLQPFEGRRQLSAIGERLLVLLALIE